MNDVSALARPRWRPSSELVWAIGATYGYRLGAAWLLALPFVQLVRGSNILQFPEGDRRLFQSGGLYLLELLSRYHGPLLANLSSTLWLLVFFSFGALIPKWLVLRALTRAQGATPSPRGAASVLPRLALLGALVWLTRAILLVAALAFAATVRSYFASARDERLPDLVFAGAVTIGLLPQLALSVWQDVARAAVVRAGLTPAHASGVALAALRRRTLPVLMRYGAVGLTSVLLVVGGGVLVGALDVARSGLWRGLLSIGAHQLVVMGCILLEVYWFHYAVQVYKDTHAAEALAPMA